MERGLLLALPLESVALRVTLAAVVVALLVRPLAAAVLRTAHARVAAGLAPFAVLVVAAATAVTDPALPALFVPTAAAAALLLPVGNGYVAYATTAVGAIVAVWAIIVAALVGRRAWRAAVTRAESLADVRPAPPRLTAAMGRLARAMDLEPPDVVVAASLRGGASVVGVRRPVIVVDAGLVALLDHAELEGVLAHELAHVARRDNLVSWVVGVVRDVVFFVPGVRWATRLVMREREVAADQRAVDATGRPGALAAGLLKVLETQPRRAATCAAFAPAAGLVERIALLTVVEAPTPVRRRLELTGVAVAAVAAVAVASVVPTTLAGEGREREALGVMVAPLAEAAAAGPVAGGPEGTEARAFAIYRRSRAAVATPAVAAGGPPSASTAEDRVANLRACAAVDGACLVGVRTGLGLRPRPVIVRDEAATARWQATPVVRAEVDGRFGLYWLARPHGTRATVRVDDRLVASGTG